MNCTSSMLRNGLLERTILQQMHQCLVAAPTRPRDTSLRQTLLCEEFHLYASCFDSMSML